MNGHRDWGGPSEEHQPVTWWKGYPVYAAHLITAVFVLSMIVTSLMSFGAIGASLQWLIFDAKAVWHGQVWRLVTYGLVNAPSITFAIDMVMLVRFGREVEAYIGRKKFLTLFAIVYLVTPVLLTLISPLVAFQFSGKTGVLAIFIAFATLYPNVPVFFEVLAKWAALIIVGIYTLMALASRDLVLLISTWAGCGAAYAYIRHEQGFFTLPSFRFRKKKAPQFRVLPDLKPQPKKAAVPVAAAAPAPSAEGAVSMAEIDALLDKIAKSGINSLTAKERAKLESRAKSR